MTRNPTLCRVAVALARIAETHDHPHGSAFAPALLALGLAGCACPRPVPRRLPPLPFGRNGFGRLGRLRFLDGRGGP
jgi:hypothetical protein